MAIGIGGWVFLAVVALLGIATVVMYNGLVALRNRYRNAFAQIDVQLKRRYDLIPNLVETVKGYAAHERETLENVVRARNMAMSAQGPHDQAAAENMITGALKSVFALQEAYPDLTLTEDEASAARPAFWATCGFVVAVDDERFPVMRLELD